MLRSGMSILARALTVKMFVLCPSEVITRDLYLADPECQGAKGLKRDNARVHRMTIG